ncbi:hypothetical protein SOVF_202490 [Spinacia oleracea]|uniref:GCN5-related N-acetyltransferase 4, chloroplastic isoform X2 n=1 Tax=Spinacia oleracea TaxID=3562 RepID=A0A9R0K9W0_SPIOL|nr:GCN5-related N-acetyltransferase 4, chloroplastic isoform X2 [Spinacia oleracea]KNA04130.1 hypothetical protein SOVF_202490 [Spinacia oleracea]
MRSIPLGGVGITITPTSNAASCKSSLLSSSSFAFNNKVRLGSSSTCAAHFSDDHFLTSSSPSAIFPGVCQASQVADLFPSISPEVVVREARLDDSWEVVETHCSSFFPEYSFPLDFVMRLDRLMAMVFGFSVPHGCKRTCLVAIIGSAENTIYIESDDLNFGGFDTKFSLNRGHVAGILTVDTVADFLPRKGPLRQRRTGIAYISNVAVRQKFRRLGIAKRLVAKAEAQAWSWGCRTVALHCDLNNPGATNLYKSQGFKCIKVPEGANWPQPKTSPDIQFNFMMKLVKPPTTS